MQIKNSPKPGFFAVQKKTKRQRRFARLCLCVFEITVVLLMIFLIVRCSVVLLDRLVSGGL